LALLIMLVPVLQIMPWPRPVWQLGAASDFWSAARILGVEAYWRPLTLRFDVTLSSLLWLQSSLALFLSATLLPRIERERAVQGIMAVAVLSALLGIAQTQATTSALYFYADAVPRTITGFFGNRNHQGDFLVIVAGLSTIFIRRGQSALRNGIAALLTTLFVAAAMTTESRSAVLLFVFLATGIVVLRLRSRPLLVFSGLGVLALTALIGSFNPVISSALSRFDAVGSTSGRVVIWSHTQEAIRQTMPLGGGLGTFQSLYESIEPLDLVGKTFVNHAHNDALQLLVETGFVGPLVLVVALLILGLEGRRAIMDRADLLAPVALVCLCVPLLHSFVDYPLRTLALGSLAAVLAAFIFAPPRYAQAQQEPVAAESAKPSPHHYIGRIASIVMGVLFLIVTIAFHASQGLTSAHEPRAALAIMPFSAQAQLDKATRAIDDGDRTTEALEAARHAWSLDAFSARALAIMGTAYLREGKQMQADTAFEAAAHLGWREPRVQDYMFARSIETGAATTAAQAADARLRMVGPERAMFSRMEALLADSAFRQALARRMRSAPVWQEPFMASLKPATPDDAMSQLRFFAELSKEATPAARKRLARTYLAGVARQQIHRVQDDPRSNFVDPRFGALEGQFAPLGWLSDEPLARRPAGGAALELQDTGEDKRVVAQQFAALSPGRYRLGYRLEMENGDTRTHGIQARCLGGQRLPVKIQSGRSPTPNDIRVTATLVVRAQKCAWQQIEIFVVGGDYTSAPGYISGVTLDGL